MISLGKKTNYHTHTRLCGHAVGMSEDYILKAIEHGYQELGMSDHGPIPRSFMTEEEYTMNWLDRQMDEKVFESVYLPDLERSIAKYQSMISIKKGLEIEFLSNRESYYQRLLSNLDYLLCGVHYFETPTGLYNTYERMNESRLIHYAETVEKACSSGFFRVLVHPDLCFANFVNQSGNHDFNETAIMVSKRIIEACIRHDVVLEINAGGIRKGSRKSDYPLDFYYPRADFWKIVSTYPDALVIVGVDAHTPEDLSDSSYTIANSFAQQFGLQVIDSLQF